MSILQKSLKDPHAVAYNDITQQEGQTINQDSRLGKNEIFQNRTVLVVVT